MEQVPRKGAKTGKNSESNQERVFGGVEPPRQKNGTVGPCHVARSCLPRPLFGHAILFKASFGVLFGGRSDFYLAIFRLGFRLVYQIKPQ